MVMGLIHRRTVSCNVKSWVELHSFSVAENDPLEIARQMAEHGITLVSISLFHRGALRAYKLPQFVVACEPELSAYNVSIVRITNL